MTDPQRDRNVTEAEQTARNIKGVFRKPRVLWDENDEQYVIEQAEELADMVLHQ